MQDRIDRAKQLLSEIHHVPIATVNDDGTPHLSPVFLAFDEQLNAYWASHPSNKHSLNIARNPSVFMAVFDSREGHGGLYIEAKAGPLEDHDVALKGHQALKKLKEQMGNRGVMGSLETYLGDGPQRIYRAMPSKFWVNKADVDDDGVIIKDNRYEVSRDDLIAPTRGTVAATLEQYLEVFPQERENLRPLSKRLRQQEEVGAGLVVVRVPSKKILVISDDTGTHSEPKEILPAIEHLCTVRTGAGADNIRYMPLTEQANEVPFTIWRANDSGHYQFWYLFAVEDVAVDESKTKGQWMSMVDFAENQDLSRHAEKVEKLLLG